MMKLVPVQCKYQQVVIFFMIEMIMQFPENSVSLQSSSSSSSYDIPVFSSNNLGMSNKKSLNPLHLEDVYFFELRTTHCKKEATTYKAKMCTEGTNTNI